MISISPFITSLGLLQKDEAASPVFQSPELLNRDKSWWLHATLRVSSHSSAKLFPLSCNP